MQEPQCETRTVPARPDAAAPPKFEEAYLRYATLLRKIAVSKFHIPSAEAETLVHDVFATYFTNADEVHEVGPYLVGGICNAARHYLRRSDATNALFCGENPCAASPDEAISRKVERKIIVARVFARIGSRCREILYRYYVHGESTQAIADMLRFKPSTIYKDLHKCRKRALNAYRSITENDRS
jgi:RNA polymerase sigma factor (sigma-70 family)